jgi:hypothetical protein
MTKDNAYKRGMDSNLNFLHLALFSDNSIDPNKVTDVKESTCYGMFADSRAYRATGDTKYLSYISYILDSGELEDIYSGVYTFWNVSNQTNNPMNIIACIDALETISKTQPNGWNQEKVSQVIDKLYNYIFFNQLVDTGQNSKLYGAFYGGTRTGTSSQYTPFDINSTMWFQKVVNQTLERKNL